MLRGLSSLADALTDETEFLAPWP